MNVKSLCLGGLIAALLGLGEVQAQSSDYPTSGMSAPPSSGEAPPAGPAGAPPMGVMQELSGWILHPNTPGCCGPIGRNGSIGSELFLRSGLSFPMGSGFLNNVLDVGWEIEGGVRTLFFNPAEDRAFTVEMSVLNINNAAADKTRTATLRNFVLPAQNQGQQPTILPTVNVTAKEMNRTFFSMAAGREWYLTGSANSGECRSPLWRIGFDTGGRWGTARLDVNELRHRNDTIGAVFVGAHSDLELPCGGCIFQFGIRTEWSYTFCDILQSQIDTDMQDINVLFTAGVRY